MIGPFEAWGVFKKPHPIFAVPQNSFASATNHILVRRVVFTNTLDFVLAPYLE